MKIVLRGVLTVIQGILTVIHKVASFIIQIEALIANFASKAKDNVITIKEKLR